MMMMDIKDKGTHQMDIHFVFFSRFLEKQKKIFLEFPPQKNSLDPLPKKNNNKKMRPLPIFFYCWTPSKKNFGPQKNKEKKIDPPLTFSFCFMAMVILSALVNRFSVYRMQMFFSSGDVTARPLILASSSGLFCHSGDINARLLNFNFYF